MRNLSAESHYRPKNWPSKSPLQPFCRNCFRSRLPLRRPEPAINHARLPQRRDGRRSGEHQIAVAYRAACSPHTTEGRPATPTCHGELASTRKRSVGGSPAKNPPRYIASPCKSAWIFVYQLGSMIPVIICSAANVASPLRGKVRPRAT